MQFFHKHKLTTNQTIQTDQTIPNFLSHLKESNHLSACSQILATQVSQKIRNDISSKAKTQQRQMQQSQMLKKHYQTIEKVLYEQNINLKMQSKYLTSQIRKSLKRQKHLKEEIHNNIALYEKTKKRLNLILKQNKQIKQYIKCQMIQLHSLIQTNSQSYLSQQIQRIVQQFCRYFSINLSQIIHNEPVIIVTKATPIQQSNIRNLQVQQLNQKFQLLINQYQNTYQPQIRKQCIDIVKQIKQRKKEKNQASIIHKEERKTLQKHLSHQSNFTLESKYSQHSLQFNQSKQQLFPNGKLTFSKYLSPITPNHKKGINSKISSSQTNSHQRY